MSLSNLGLDAFLQIIRDNSVQEAALSLGLTPTAITQRIRALEKELGTTLFLRSKKGMLPTEAGKKLLQYAQLREQLETDIISKISDEAISSPVRITFAASTYYTYSKVIPIAQEMALSYPNLFFQFDVDDNDGKLQRLKEGKADFIVLPREDVPLEMDSKLLKKRKYVLVGGDKYKKDKKDPTIIDYAAKDPFTDLFFKKLKINYSPDKLRHYINNTMMIPRLIEGNLGVAVLDNEHFKDLRKEFKIHNLYPQKYYEIEWALVWVPRPEMPDYFKEIIDKF